jgi:predicted trehalose synthase
VKNKFPNAPKIYGMIKIQDRETIGILEDVPNSGTLGDIYWNELNNMVNSIFKVVDDDDPSLSDKEKISGYIKNYCANSLQVSEKIGLQIKELHEALILQSDPLYSKETVSSMEYLKDYTDNLLEMVERMQETMSKSSEGAFYSSPKVLSTLIDIKDIIEKFRSEFSADTINIQPVHQDLHFQQILVNKSNGDYLFYFIDFEGDPQLDNKEKEQKFPIEKDLGSFLRSLSYIKFNTLLKFIEDKIIDKDKIEVPAEFLFNLYFRKSSKITKKQKILENALKILNVWENKLMGKIFEQSPDLQITLINYFTIERVLQELSYELFFRPDKILIPILGLKEIIDKY